LVRPEDEVAVAHCLDYQENRVGVALERVWQCLRVDELVRPGHTVLVKVNCLGPYLPERAVTTHPAMVLALCRMIRSRGARVQVGDSAGGATRPAFTQHSLEVAGIAAAALEGGAEVVNFDARPAAVVENPRPGGPNPLYLAAAVREADVIINVPKLKTHLLTGLTAAVKNSFGCLPGAYKQVLHRDYPQVDAFSQVLLDISDVVRPHLHLVDAVVAMEGNGPSGGKAVNCGLLFGSRSALSTDVAAALAAGWSPWGVSTNRAARIRGRLTPPVHPRMVGDSLRNSCGRPLQRPVTAGWVSRLPAPLMRWAMTFYDVALVVDGEKCNACGTCAVACPVQAVTVAGVARVDPASCIQCYCCMELCTRQAVNVVRGRRPGASRRCRGGSPGP
jgi:uncharacterized protein (DUF362 family)/NAD-dependent dihydropyrimidine dehydrogenase PreA subunit